MPYDVNRNAVYVGGGDAEPVDPEYLAAVNAAVAREEQAMAERVALKLAERKAECAALRAERDELERREGFHA